MISLLRARGPAKLNLTLEVLGRRTDGYHEVRTVLQAIDLCDTLLFQADEHISLFCQRTPLLTGDNTILTAARLLRERSASPAGAVIELEKHIPVAAGLGGGSSDGAATLRALNGLWKTGLDRQTLQPLAEMLGSDAPFFLYGGTALGEGKGERITQLPSAISGPIVLLVPPLTGRPEKTGQLYALLNTADFTGGQFTQRLTEVLRKGQPIAPSLLYNAFERVALGFFPGLQEYRQRFLESGASQVHLAGSGPALFTLAGDETQAARICQTLRRQRLTAYVVRPFVEEKDIH
ncbi:MAG: ispE [Dehalococcoidia bacterium]|nr:ispE [Dehalococcoidia bacterium]